MNGDDLKVINNTSPRSVIEFSVAKENDNEVVGELNINDQDALNLYQRLKIVPNGDYVVDELKGKVYRITKVETKERTHLRLVDVTAAYAALNGYEYDSKAKESYTVNAFNKQTIEYLKQLNIKRNSEGFAIIMCDGNCFKYFNDCYGHLVGDKVIELVSLSLRNAISYKDILCRFGGDEFCILLKDIKAADFENVLDRICHKLNNLYLPVSTDNQNLNERITLSFGGVHVELGDDKLEDDEIMRLLQQVEEEADKNLIAVKAENEEQIKKISVEGAIISGKTAILSTHGKAVVNFASQKQIQLVTKKIKSDINGSHFITSYERAEKLLASKKTY